MIRKLDHEEIASLLAYGYETDSTCGSPRFKRGDHVKCKKGDGAGVVSKIYHYWPTHGERRCCEDWLTLDVEAMLLAIVGEDDDEQ